MPCACASPAASQSCSAMWSAARERHRPARRGERALERQPVEVLHDDVQRAVGELPGEEHVHDVRVREARRDLAPRGGSARRAAGWPRARGGGSSPRRRGRCPSGRRGRRAPSRRRPTSWRISMCPRISRPTYGSVAAAAAMAPGDGRQRRAVERAEQRVGRVARAARRAGLRRRGLRGFVPAIIVALRGVGEPRMPRPRRRRAATRARPPVSLVRSNLRLTPLSTPPDAPA